MPTKSTKSHLLHLAPEPGARGRGRHGAHVGARRRAGGEREEKESAVRRLGERVTFLRARERALWLFGAMSGWGCVCRC